MKRTTIAFVSILTAAAAGNFVFWNSVHAASGLSISPLTFELTANPGDLLENTIRIYNPTDSAVAVKMEIEDFTVSGETGQVIIEPAETETYSLARWVQVSPETFTLEPAEQKIVDFIINVPADAEPGGHYGSIVAAGSQIAGTQATGAFVVPRVASLLLVSVPGEVEENLRIRNFEAPRYSEYGPINFGITFENLGTIHEKPKGLITITNWLGQKVDSFPFPEKNILPAAARKIDVSWPHKWLWAGKYTATITGSYGIGNTQLLPKVITFWAFPWKFGIVIFVVLIFLILARKRFITAFKILLMGDRKR